MFRTGNHCSSTWPSTTSSYQWIVCKDVHRKHQELRLVPLLLITRKNPHRHWVRLKRAEKKSGWQRKLRRKCLQSRSWTVLPHMALVVSWVDGGAGSEIYLTSGSGTSKSLL